MSPRDRYQWIEAWMREEPLARAFVDVLNTDFIYEYAEATNAKLEPMLIGAPKCKQLGRDLGAMFSSGKLKRQAVGLSAGDASMGFPKWTYSYSLPKV